MKGLRLFNAPLATARFAKHRRGFTLVELLVAMSAGVLVGIAALLLAKNATRFFQHEARISAAQLSVTLGMNRLTADLQRASLLASRSHQLGLDPNLCQDGVALPTTITNWTGLAITKRGSELAHPVDLAQGASAENNLHPDSIVIGGSLAIAERFQIDVLPEASGANQLTLQANNDVMGWLRATAARNGQTLGDVLAPIFASGRFLRVVNSATPKISMYAIIRGITVAGPLGQEIITVDLDPSLRLPVLSATCGVHSVKAKGHYYASVVYRVRYDIRSLQNDPTYKRLVAFDPAVAPVSGEDTRTELVRVELDETGAEIPKTLELISEFAVDLKFSITVASQSNNPTMTTFPFDADEVEKTPELVRAVQVRLSTRTRAPDRETPLSAGSQPYRFAVKPAPLTPRFARIRNLYSTVSLPNQADFAP